MIFGLSKQFRHKASFTMILGQVFNMDWSLMGSLMVFKRRFLSQVYFESFESLFGLFSLSWVKFELSLHSQAILSLLRATFLLLSQIWGSCELFLLPQAILSRV